MFQNSGENKEVPRNCLFMETFNIEDCEEECSEETMEGICLFFSVSTINIEISYLPSRGESTGHVKLVLKDQHRKLKTVLLIHKLILTGGLV